MLWTVLNWYAQVVIGRAGEYGTMRVAANWKVWESKKVAKEFPQVSTFLYDGKRAAWSMTDLGDGNLLKVADINLDEEQGRQPRTKPDILDLRIIKAKKVNIGLLQTYMDGKMSWDVPILEAINFFNHLMRSTPAKQYINFGGSYFRREISEQRDIAVLGPYNEAYKGVYQSIRPAQGGKLIVNVDVSNGTFWRPDLMVNHAVHLLRLSSLSELVGHLLGNDINRQRDPAAWQKAVTARKKAATDMLSRRLRGLLFTSTCQTEGPKRKYKVAEIRFPNAQEQKIKVKVNGDSGMMTVEQFYKKKFPNSHFRNPTLPLVRTHKADVVFPLEFCLIERDQRFMHKLTPDQTANMIRFAVTDGHDRAHRVKLGTQMLNWKDDPWLKQYQLSVEQEMINTKARVLPAPQVNYDPASKNRNNQPERRLVVSNGKWNLQGKKFYKKGQLDSWGILILTKYALLRHKKNQLPDDPGDSRNYTSPELAKSINGFVQQLANCGVRLGPNAKSPVTYGFNGNNPSQSMHKLWEACLARFKTPPQLLCFVCVDKGVEPYSTIKKYCDTVLGCVSQGMNNMNFGKASPQYFANVAMKVNAKLGGFSCFAGPTDAKGNPTNEYGLSSKPIMYIGADVSHAPRQFVNQGIMRNPSLAAVTCSMDKLGCAYSAKCFTQPGGLELMDKTKLQPTFRELFGHYGRATKKTPEVIVYIRDGVSEGQYGYVLTEEVKAMEEELLKSERIQAMKVKVCFSSYQNPASDTVLTIISPAQVDRRRGGEASPHSFPSGPGWRRERQCKAWYHRRKGHHDAIRIRLVPSFSCRSQRLCEARALCRAQRRQQAHCGSVADDDLQSLLPIRPLYHRHLAPYVAPVSCIHD